MACEDCARLEARVAELEKAAHKAVVFMRGDNATEGIDVLAAAEAVSAFLWKQDKALDSIRNIEMLPGEERIARVVIRTIAEGLE